MFWNVLNKHGHETTIIKISWKSFAQQRRVVGPSKSKLINWWNMMITSRIAKLWISSASKYVSELSTSIYPSYLIMKIYHICPCLQKNSLKLSLLPQWWIWCKMESNLSHVQQKLKHIKAAQNAAKYFQFGSVSQPLACTNGLPIARNSFLPSGSRPWGWRRSIAMAIHGDFSLEIEPRKMVVYWEYLWFYNTNQERRTDWLF